jgi:ribosomal protein L21
MPYIIEKTGDPFSSHWEATYVAAFGDKTGTSCGDFPHLGKEKLRDYILKHFPGEKVRVRKYNPKGMVKRKSASRRKAANPPMSLATMALAGAGVYLLYKYVLKTRS